MKERVTLKEAAAKLVKALGVQDVDVTGKFLGMKHPLPYEYEMRVPGKTISLFCDEFLFYVEDGSNGQMVPCATVDEVIRAAKGFVKEAA